MNFALPFIHEYSAKVQLSVLIVLLLISYLNRKARFVIAILATGVIAFKFAVSLSSWVYYAFKGIAMLGFYMKFFCVGLNYIKSGIDYLLPDFLDGLVEAWEKGKEEDRMKEEEKKRQARWEEARRHETMWEEAIRQEAIREEARKQEARSQGRKKEGKRRR